MAFYEGELVAKSKVGLNMFRPIMAPGVKEKVKDLRSIAEAQRRAGQTPKGVYSRMRDLSTEQIKAGIKARDTRWKMLTGEKLPTSGPARIEGSPGYNNLHPFRVGSKKGGTTHIAGSPELAKNPSALKHERMHGDKSSWRLAQIEADPEKLMREEARVDLISGTHNMTFGPGMKSHTRINRPIGEPKRVERAARNVGRIKRAAPASLRDAIPDEDQIRQAYKPAQEFRRVQDNINAKGQYGKPGARTRKEKATDAAVLTAVGGGIAGAVAWDQRKHPRDSKGRWARKGGVAKSFVPGKGFVPAVQAGKDALRTKGRYATSGVSPEHKTFARSLENNKAILAKTTRRPKNVQTSQVNGRTITTVQGKLPRSVAGMTINSGGRKGSSTVVLGRKTGPGVLSHEMAHATPRRSSYRTHQIARDPAKRAREEARADGVIKKGFYGMVIKMSPDPSSLHVMRPLGKTGAKPRPRLKKITQGMG